MRAIFVFCLIVTLVMHAFFVLCLIVALVMYAYYYFSDLRYFCFCSFTKLVKSVFFVTTDGGGVA